MRRALLPETGRAPVDFPLAQALALKQRSEPARVRAPGLEQRSEPARVWELGLEERTVAAQARLRVGPTAARVKAGRAFHWLEQERHRREPLPARARLSCLAPGRVQ